MEPSKIPTIKEIGGTIIDVRRLVNPDDKHWSCTNMSIGYWPKKGYVAAFRSSNYVINPQGVYQVVDGGAHIKNKIYFAELDNDFKPKNLRQIDFSGVGKFESGCEDPKLF
jgi:hypothetical protein